MISAMELSLPKQKNGKMGQRLNEKGSCAVKACECTDKTHRGATPKRDAQIMLTEELVCMIRAVF